MPLLVDAAQFLFAAACVLVRLAVVIDVGLASAADYRARCLKPPAQAIAGSRTSVLAGLALLAVQCSFDGVSPNIFRCCRCLAQLPSAPSCLRGLRLGPVAKFPFHRRRWHRHLRLLHSSSLCRGRPRFSLVAPVCIRPSFCARLHLHSAIARRTRIPRQRVAF